MSVQITPKHIRESLGAGLADLGQLDRAVKKLQRKIEKNEAKIRLKKETLIKEISVLDRELTKGKKLRENLLKAASERAAEVMAKQIR